MSLPDDVESVLLAAEKPLTIGELRERLPNPGVGTLPVVMALQALQRKGLARECRNASDQNAWARSSGSGAAQVAPRPAAAEGHPGEPLSHRVIRLLGASLAPMCTTDIRTALAVDGSVVSATLCNLREQGKVERRGQGHSGLWALIDESKQAAARAERRAFAATKPAPMATPVQAPAVEAAVSDEDVRRERLSELIAEIGDRITATTEQLALTKRAYNALLKECRQPKAPEPEEATA